VVGAAAVHGLLTGWRQWLQPPAAPARADERAIDVAGSP
jgi:hypothetical protein